MSCLLEFGGAGGGGTPAGPSGAVQFNNSGAFGGDAGFTYAGLGQATLALGTITANAKAVNITGTWNNAAVTFDAPLFMNITNTASATASAIADLQVGGTTIFNIQPTASVAGGVQAQIGTGSTTSQGWIFGTDASGFSGIWITGVTPSTTNYSFLSSSTITYANNATSVNLRVGNSDRLVVSNGSIQVVPNLILFGSGNDISLGRMGAVGVLGLNDGATASGFQVYNTTDVTSGAPTNYERGVIDWTTAANVLTIGTQAGGTGAGRSLTLSTVGNGSINITSTNRLNFTSTNPIIWLNATNSIMSLNDATTSLVLASNFGFGWTSTVNVSGTSPDTGLSRAAAKVVEFSDGAANANGWMQWGGQSRVTADVTFTSTVVLGPVTGLSVNVQAGRTYCFVAELSWTDAAAGGLQLAISGTCTATNIIYDGYIIDSAANGIKGNAQATALGGVVASAVTTGTAGHARIAGTITVNAAGTLLVQAAQNTSNATPTTIKRGSFFYVWDNA